ncbi:MAG: Peptidoglycan glycosyltransferase [Candidatus Daviesbacteria bacterium GW2011_GWA1_41_61]|uniref:Peptidoglycan glycosyltransferase n=1 Tax=Candidatus Daviesbacteria bacterium GW2011_GWA2_40_9 TaxID=1618424 RepID=A0A0G0U1J9_9BACT|nr:MAG: Peptidoglycan glycosyltransferase [Candidatus Daviesbacteria bacterium GW2011_GWA2_40_9]KKR92910.1 MAG: Peptidoglycan glycosyltransferase [Candidatus Daviesbacteria bacterium GW2011_GWB1_41_15]KKS15454.1 MAG: Peptidoglycan glycosyltransferase [Candidatus Daviesbacteria bacterium GW2011_GWA1_41_61]
MRLRLLKTFYIVALAMVAFRLFYWQVVQADDLAARAEQQHTATSAIEAPRGLILSADGGILAANRPAFVLYGLPKIIKDKEEVSAKLAKILLSNASPSAEIDLKETLKIKKAEIADKLSKDLSWVALERNIDFSLKKQIEDLGLTGIGFENQVVRFYPEGSSSAHILGFVGSDSLGRQKGYFGIEGSYDRELKGIGGVLTEERDAQGAPILSGKYYKKEPKNGHTVTLTVDRGVQRIVERDLRAGMEKYGAKSASAVVMNPQTGEILALASYPNFDPNSFFEFSTQTYKNPVLAESYEPGSTFKVLIMAAGINEGLIDPQTSCDICSGPITTGGYTIRTWNNKYYDDSTMAEVIIHSDNTGMVFVSRKLGLDKMYQYIQDFGFGSLTQIDLLDELTPDIRPKDEWREIDLATASFGQGIAVTPIQMVRAVAAIANGGKLMEPHITKSIEGDNKVTLIKPRVLRQLISEETATIIKEMMVEAVENGETKRMVPKGYQIAGKTGTAQIPVAGHYDAEKTIASFIGFAPADNPKFVMLVIFREPSSSIYGSETAAPTFFEIAKELLPYYNTVPTE